MAVEKSEVRPLPSVSSRFDAFVLGIVQAEVQRKGIGLSPGSLAAVLTLAKQMIAAIDATS